VRLGDLDPKSSEHTLISLASYIVCSFFFSLLMI
jgi:hypothetical protein